MAKATGNYGMKAIRSNVEMPRPAGPVIGPPRRRSRFKGFEGVGMDFGPGARRNRQGRKSLGGLDRLRTPLQPTSTQ